MLIGHVIINDQSQVDNIYENTISNQGQIQDLQKAVGGRYLLNYTLLPKLHDQIPYTELRIFCHKPWHTRTFHAKIQLVDSGGQQVYRYMSGDQSAFDYCNKTIEFLSDDTSMLSQEPCENQRAILYYGKAGLYGHIIHKPNTYHVMLTSDGPSKRIECDDRFWETVGFSYVGQWKYFVR